MNFKRLLLLVLVVVFCSGCNKEKVYFSDSVTFNQNVWQRFDHLKFNVPIDDVNKKYDLVFVVNYDKELNYKELPIQVNSETPDGERRFSEFHMKLKDKNGNFIGEQQDDGTMIYTHIVRRDFTLNQAGELKVDIECFFPKYFIPNIHSAGVKLVKAQPEPEKKPINHTENK